MEIKEHIDINVEPTSLAEFQKSLIARLSIIAGLVQPPTDDPVLKARFEEGKFKPKLVLGPPGVAKTASVYAAQKQINKMCEEAGLDIHFGFKKIQLGQTTVGSLEGIPVVDPTTGKTVRVQMPDLPDEEVDGEYGILFLDELTTANEAQMQPALGLADMTRSCGSYKLPKNWYVVAAGNGPECTNFVRLDAAMITRFDVYDIHFDFKRDWRHYAEEQDISPDILAFLAFSPDAMSEILESDDVDNLGMQSVSARSWRDFDYNLKERALLGDPVSNAELAKFASRTIGSKRAKEFAAFMTFKTTLKVTPEDILDGKAEYLKEPVQEEFMIILEGCLKLMRVHCKNTDMNNDADVDKLIHYLANYLNWMMELYDVDKKIMAFKRVANKEETSISPDLIFDPRLSELSPKTDEFFTKYSEQILECNID